MSYWIHAYCNNSVASVTPQELKQGIAERLARLTYLFCPDEEEDPREVLSRLRVEDESSDGTFRVFLMHYRPGTPVFIRIDRTDDRGDIEELDQEVLSERTEPSTADIRQRLSKATENVSFCLKAHDVRGMGFPLSIAAACYLVQKAGGIILSGHYSWMIPRGNEVDVLAEFQG